MKITFFTQYYHKGGTYFRWHNLAIAMIRLGNQITVYASSTNWKEKRREEIVDGVKYIIIPCLPTTKFFGAATDPLSALYRVFIPIKEQCDIYHMFQPFKHAYFHWKIQKFRNKKSAYIYDWDDLWTNGCFAVPQTLKDQYIQGVVKKLEKKLPKIADATTVCSAFLENMSKHFGAKNTLVLHNGFWRFEPTPKQEARRRLKLREDAIYMGFMGRTFAELDWCFEALEQNRAQYPNLRLALCGMPESTLEKLPDLLKERIDYLGQMQPEETRIFSAALDVGLLPLEDNNFNQSRFPIKFAEYMATGTPVLCSDVGECSILGKNMQWVYLAGNTKEDWLMASKKICEAIQNRQIAKVNIEQVNAFLGWDHLAKQLLKFYQDQLFIKNGQTT